MQDLQALDGLVNGRISIHVVLAKAAVHICGPLLSALIGKSKLILIWVYVLSIAILFNQQPL